MAPKLSTTYDSQFWSRRATSAASSASACVPLLYELLRPNSVVDVGCGQGHWLAEFARLGVGDVLGVDGSYAADEDRLLIPQSKFLDHDLSSPLSLHRQFSVALCLEVAEHLHAEAARQLVENLTTLAPCIVFSAAIPGQGGIGHVNEQWPWYWQEIFHDFEYVQLDIIRPLIWKNVAIAPWYRQNIFVYASKSECATLLAHHQHETDSLTLVSRDALERLTRPSLVKRTLRKVVRLTGLWRLGTA